MSNIFNQQLEQAVKAVNTKLQQSELAQSNNVKAAKLGLYYAHGLTSKNTNQLAEDQAKNVETGKQNEVASTAVTICQNILTAANAALLDASNTTSNASATAANIQKAANALTNLSANVASVLAVATSLDKGSKIQRLVEKANKATKKAAELAEEAGLIALDVTVKASQSRAAGTVNQAGTVKGNMTTLSKSLTDTFSKQQEVINGELSTLHEAITGEHEQAGNYKTALAEDNALISSSSFINTYINHNLTFKLTDTNGGKFELSFYPFKEKEEGETIISEYRVLIAKEDDAASFNTEYAKAAPHYVSIPVTPNAKRYTVKYVTPNYLKSPGHKKEDDENVARDYTGAPVNRAVPYVFFVYVIYTNEYQNQSNDTNGVLSLPSSSFTLKTSLPVVDAPKNTSIAFYKKDASDSVRIAFKVPTNEMVLTSGIDMNDLMDFRVFIFSDKDRKAHVLNEKIDEATGVLYELEMKYSQREEDYLKAKQAYDQMLSAGDVSEQEVTEIKNELDVATAHYQSAKANYHDQIKKVDELNSQKISDFYVDEEILESIPASNYMVAKKNDNLLNDLTGMLKDLKDSQSKLNDQEKEINEEISNLEKAIGDKEGGINKLLAQENPVSTRLKELRKKLADDIAKLEAYHHEKVQIKTLYDAQEFRKQIGDEQSTQTQLVDAVIKDFEDLAAVQVEETTLSSQVLDARKEWKKLKNELIIAQLNYDMVKGELETIPVAMENIERELDKLQGESEDKNFTYFEAVNEQGDFTDNYGEPLATGLDYCAVILSIIKDSEPEAQGLYQNQMSNFTQSATFNSQEL